MLKRTPSSFTPLEDGRYLLLGNDSEFNRREIAKFSERDAANYPAYEAIWSRSPNAWNPC